jgi:hypothetical protein
MRRLLLAGVILAFPIGALSVGYAGQASASIRNPSTVVTCSKIKANILTGTTAKLKGCSDTKNTGGSGKAPIATLTSGSGTLTWHGTGTTTLAGGSFTAVSPDTCPTPTGGSQDLEYTIMYNVTGGTGAAAKSIKAGWTLTATVCINQTTGAVALLAGTDVQIGAGL